MPPPADRPSSPDGAMLDKPTARRLDRLRRRAWRVVAWERAAPLLWAPATLIVLFVALALTGAPSVAPWWLHAAGLAGFAAGLAVAAWRFLRRWRRPSAHDVERRIETDSGARHRPLAALRDRPEDGGGPGAALWAAHRDRLAATVRALTVRGARPDMAAADPWGMRQLGLLLLLVVAVGSRGEWSARLSAALTLDFDQTAASLGGGDGGVTVEAWLAPPEATGLAPIFLPSSARKLDAAPLAVPVGSRLTARASGGGGAPKLLANGGETGFVEVDGRNFQAEATIRGGDVIAVTRRGATLAHWRVSVTPDRPPEVDFAAPPTAERGALRVDYAASDDYGLARVKLRVAPAGDVGTMAAVEEAPLSLPSIRPRQARSGGAVDMTANLWAGLPASLTLIAEDAAGQTGESPSIVIVLPERRFNHPTAQALVAERRRLTVDGEWARAGVADALRELAGRPAAFRGDIPAFLAIVAAAGRLEYDLGPRSLRGAQALMWEAALRIEDGGASQAERAVRQAQQALADALEREASDAELQALMDRLQTAMDAWFEALEQQMRQAMRDGEKLADLPPELADQLMDRADLQNMMERMRDMAQTGARDGARQMLSQLQQMMDRMQAGAPEPNGARERNQAFDLMRRLRELADKQQELLDETFRQSGRGAQTGEGEDSAAARRRAAKERAEARRNRQAASPLIQRQADRQQELRRGLGDAVRELGELSGEVPRPLGRAEREMREAENALRNGLPDAALEPQGEAVEALRQGLQSFAEKIMQQMTGAMAGAGQGQPGGAAGRGRDPLGRMQPQGVGGMDTQSVKTPTETELRRARDILQELRRRAGEPARPLLERDYIDRLLRRF